jgi:hypothetical protein
MDVSISTSDPDNVDPVMVKDALEAANLFVLSVTVNDGERVWESEMYHTGRHEQEAEAEAAARLVPDLNLDVSGTFEGNAYPATYEYRVTMAHDPEDGIQLLVTDSGGAPVAKPLTITEELADGIISMGQTNHDLDGYQDDWTLPAGMGRTLSWILQTDMDHHVELGEGTITEIADWLEYATGEKTWDWATDGEVYEV